MNRVLGREVGGKQNILVLNDEAHHAYRIRRPEPDEDEDDLFGEEEEAEEFFKEATVWVEGLDRIHKLRGINFCVDLSATPYFLGRVGQDTNRIFPWVVSDFGLTDAIESGLVKIPQLAVRDTTGAEIPGYFNIWRWILPQADRRPSGAASRAARSPRRSSSGRNTPIAMLGGLGRSCGRSGRRDEDDPRPPVFILVCKNTQIAKVVYEWLAEDKPPAGIPPAEIDGVPQPRRRERTRSASTPRSSTRPTPARPRATSRAGCASRSTRSARLDWPDDRQGRPLYPEGFEELAKKLERPLHPPGRDVRCIVSVGMLTEGWDCNTVTHIVGLRPFMSQLLCEQVVGRGLRRPSYEVGRRRQADRRGRQGLRRAVRGHPVQGSTGRPAAASRRSGTTSTRCPDEGRVRDPLPARRGLPAGHPQPGDGGLGRACRRRRSTRCKIPPEVRDEGGAARTTRAGRRSPGRASSRDVDLQSVPRGPAAPGAGRSSWRAT